MSIKLRKVRASALALATFVTAVSTACGDTADRLAAPPPSRAVGGDCVICDDGTVALPAMQQKIIRLAGEADPGPIQMVPDTSLRGPMTSAERARFGAPASHGTLTVIGAAHLIGRTAEFLVGAHLDVSGIVSVVAYASTNSPDTSAHSGRALGCRGFRSCLDFGSLSANCDRQRWNAAVNVSGTGWTEPLATYQQHQNFDSCRPAEVVSTGGDNTSGTAGFQCHDEWVQLSVDGGETWEDRLASVCES